MTSASAVQPAAASKWSWTEARPIGNQLFLLNAHCAHSTSIGFGRAFTVLTGSRSILWFNGQLGPFKSTSLPISCRWPDGYQPIGSLILRRFQFVKIVFYHFVAFICCCGIAGRCTLGRKFWRFLGRWCCVGGRRWRLAKGLFWRVDCSTVFASDSGSETGCFSAGSFLAALFESESS